MDEILLNSREHSSKNVNDKNLSQVEELDAQNWLKSKQSIIKNVKEIVWKAWIEPLHFDKYENGVLYIQANSSLIANRAETQYYETIFSQASLYFLNLRQVKITPEENTINTKKNVNKISFKEKTKLQNFTDLSFVDSVSMKINPAFTFDNFIVGEANRMAYAAAKRICKGNTATYNPLYIYGSVGMGKTHLLNAIAIDLKKNTPDLKIVFMSAERFMYQFIKAIRLKDTIKFKDEFRSVDILIIDDIQFIGGKESTQEEFFYTFNDLINLGKQIIISSNKSPFELSDLDEKLKSRLAAGLVVDFLPTDYNLRFSILKKKINLLSLEISTDVLHFLATKIVNNIRELEGALNRLCANYELTGKLISIENAQELLSDILSANEREISIDYIQKIVSSYYNLNLSAMVSSRRSISIARPRQIAMYLSKTLTAFSYPEIGKNFGGKDHTTVMHAVKKVESLLENNQKLQKQIFDLKKSILSS